MHAFLRRSQIKICQSSKRVFNEQEKIYLWYSLDMMDVLLILVQHGVGEEKEKVALLIFFNN